MQGLLLTASRDPNHPEEDVEGARAWIQEGHTSWRRLHHQGEGATHLLHTEVLWDMIIFIIVIQEKWCLLLLRGSSKGG